MRYRSVLLLENYHGSVEESVRDEGVGGGEYTNAVKFVQMYCLLWVSYAAEMKDERRRRRKKGSFTL